MNGSKQRARRRICLTSLSVISICVTFRSTSATEHIIRHWNAECLHAGVEYVTPKEELLGRDQDIFAEQGRKIGAARASLAVARADTKAVISPCGVGAALT